MLAGLEILGMAKENEWNYSMTELMEGCVPS